jgi:hypothetical protein
VSFFTKPLKGTQDEPMAARIKADVLQALDDWKAGKPVRSVELGHAQRMVDQPGMSARIGDDRFFQDQERAHAYCFRILEWFSKEGIPFPADHDAFMKQCDVLERKFREQNDGLTAEELDGAESLAWKALLIGWQRAIDGHKDANYITVTNPNVPKTKAAT